MSTGDFGAPERQNKAEVEARFLSLHAQYGSEVISVMGPDNDLLYESDSILRILGYRHAETALAQKEVLPYIHPDDTGSLARAIEACFSTPGESPPAEFRILDVDGNWRWLESRGINLFEDPEIGAVVVSTREITDRKRVEEELVESERRLRAVAGGAPVILFAIDTKGEITFDAGRGLSALGLAPGSSVGLSAFDIYQDDPGVLDNLHRALAGEEVSDTVELPGASGTLYFDTLYSPLWDVDGRVEGVVGVATDVTERKRTQEALERSEALYRAVVEDQTELVSRFTPLFELKLVNDAYCRYFGMSRQELIGSHFLDFLPEESRKAARKHILSLSREEPVATIEHPHVSPDGQTRWMQWTDRAIFDGEGRLLEYQCVGRDVTERRRLQEELEYQALHDTLTGLPERALLTDRLRGILARAGRGGESTAVLFVDVDNLKLVNDSLGHEAGDRLLCAVGERLRGCVRPADTVARFGGDEFVVVPDSPATEEDALLLAARLLQKLGAPVHVGERELSLSVSVGIAIGGTAGDSEEESAEELIRHADAAMYRAKAAGGGGCSVYDPEMDLEDLERLELLSDLRGAVERGELRTYYQHKVDLATGEVAGWEALLRWEHPERGTIPPETFIPLAEQTGLIVPIGKWVLRRACEQAKLWRERDPREPGQFMSVNLSPRQFADPGLEEEIEQTLRRTGLPAGALDLEITERVLLEDEDSDFPRINKLKRLGLSFSLDDFGTGYSSLASLKQLPADCIKIDHSFVRGLPTDPEDEAFVAAMVSLARALGLKVVAEGVESAEQWTRLWELGCDYGQGYYFAPPLPAEET